MIFDNTFYILAGVIVLLIILMMFMCTNAGKTVQKFGAMKSLTTPNITNKSLSSDTVYIIYTEQCGYCREAKPEFENAEKKSKKVVMVDATDENNKSILEKLSVKGYPTIVKGDGTKFEGSRTAADIIKFADEN